MSGVTDANTGSSSSSSKPTSANPSSSNAAPAPTAVTEADDNDSSSSSDEDEDGASTATGGDAAQSAKQRKKKKSKAAAKLRKKLGLSSPSNAISTPSSDGKLLVSGNSRDGKVSDEVVSQVQRAVTESHGPSAASSVTKSNLAKVMAMMNLERDAMLKSQGSKQKAQKQIADHKFWKTQPVMKPTDSPLLSSEEGSIEQSVPPEQVRQEPYPLPNDFEWVQVDVDNEAELKEVYELLRDNYVEDDDATFRFEYSPEFLHWVLKHPRYKKSWHVGVRVVSTKKLIAFISGIPHELRVREKAYQSTEINFLCVHKKLRSKRLAPVLIKEVTRQCHLTGVFHAIYTVGSVLPTPVSCSRYYHRTINAKKLVEIGFSAVPHGMSMDAHMKRFELPAKPILPGLREMEKKDVGEVGRLMRRYMKRFDMAPRFSDHEVEHILLSGRGKDRTSVGEASRKRREAQVTWTYVVENGEGRITDMFAFYSLPSSILENDKHSSLNAAYLFYYATDAVFQSSPPPPSSSLTGGSSSSSPASERSLALASGKEAWQCNALTNLTPTELSDESSVSSWDSEPPSIKSALKTRLNLLINALLIIARDFGFDVVNCVTVMDNPLFLQEQKFGPGDGFLRFYLFNWRTKPIAGGMGSRPGEAELDPVQQYAKSMAKKASSGQADVKGLAEELIRKAAKNPADVGSGNGIVMV